MYKNMYMHMYVKMLDDKVRWNLNETAILTLSQTLIEPYLQYCCEIWGVANKTSSSHFVVLQKRMVRLICKVNKLTSTACLFRKLKVLKFNRLSILQNCFSDV